MVLNLAVNAIQPEVVGTEIFELLDKANKESEETHNLLDNLLKWTKSQTGRMNVVYQDFDLNDVIPGVVDIFVMIADTKKIRLDYTPCKEKLVVRADNDMLKTVVRNFMSNAIKFSLEGSVIEISAERENNFAKINIRDHGVGIAQERIDELFQKGETTYGTSGEEGSGLGLQLCADFARKNGGDVRVESVLGEGSMFSVLVPLKVEAQ